MKMRDLLNIVEGDNGGPVAIKLVPDGKHLGQKVYRAMQGDKKLGLAYARYKAPKAGEASGTTFTMEFCGKSFSGSRARLMAWLEKATSADT